MKTIIKLNAETLDLLRLGNLSTDYISEYIHFPFWLKSTEKEMEYEMIHIHTVSKNIMETLNAFDNEDKDSLMIFSYVPKVDSENKYMSIPQVFETLRRYKLAQNGKLIAKPSKQEILDAISVTMEILKPLSNIIEFNNKNKQR